MYLCLLEKNGFNAEEYEIIPYEAEKVTTDSGKELELQGFELRVK